MQVLKFGGSSVANAENISKVAHIVRREGARGRTIVVVSALGGITDLLLQGGRLAAAGDLAYKETVQTISQRHLDTTRALLPVTNQSSVLSQVMQRCNEIEDIYNGIYLLRECSDRTKDRILSYGELISSQLLSAFLASQEVANQWVDARELVVTNSQFTRALVDFGATNKKIES
ncbi:MAG TPA: bifunctional aspartate kinase/homoserine dehydrogenase I, partial [Chitinophagaceae bacterium]|nr:bifunctional aspartate kinase/homoserine dehydrogenase I [Chitinophagaceae bacterium]